MLKVANSVISASRITGVLPVANGGTGVTTSTGTGNTVLSASPTLSGDVTLSTGSLIPSTAAKGVNFTANTPAAGMTSQLLNSYEEGTWAPVDGSGAGLTLTVTKATYTKIGRSVFIQGFIDYPVTASASPAILGGLPFTASANGYAPWVLECGVVSAGTHLRVRESSALIDILTQTYGSVLNSTLSAQGLIFCGTYTI